MPYKDPQKQAASTKRWRDANPERYRAAVRKSQEKARAENPEEFKSATARSLRKSKLKAQYGMTVEAYDAMLEVQGGVCKICSANPEKGRRLSVDHCHTTGRIRGLLCSNCNLAIGSMRDNPLFLESAAQYLRDLL